MEETLGDKSYPVKDNLSPTPTQNGNLQERKMHNAQLDNFYEVTVD